MGEYRPDRSEDAVDIRVRYPSEQRGVIALDELQIVTPGGLVPLSNFVKVKLSNNVDTLQRVNGVPIMMILANVAPGVLADSKVNEIQAWIDSQDWPPELASSFAAPTKSKPSPWPLSALPSACPYCLCLCCWSLSSIASIKAR